MFPWKGKRGERGDRGHASKKRGKILLLRAAAPKGGGERGGELADTPISSAESREKKKGGKRKFLLKNGYHVAQKLGKRIEGVTVCFGCWLTRLGRGGMRKTCHFKTRRILREVKTSHSCAEKNLLRGRGGDRAIIVFFAGRP